MLKRNVSARQEAGMPENSNAGQSGGVNISGSVGSVGGDIVGRDKITGAPSAIAIDEALRPLRKALETTPAEARAEAESKVEALGREAAKGQGANDSAI